MEPITHKELQNLSKYLPLFLIGGLAVALYMFSSRKVVKPVIEEKIVKRPEPTEQTVIGSW